MFLAMRYIGGKARIATWVAGHIKAVKESRTRYVEPFLGSGAVFAKVAPMFQVSECGDAHEDLALLWAAVADGWVPPEHVSREDYQTLKTSGPSALRGFAGYGASFGGKWFGGYVDTVWDVHHQRHTKPYAQAASKSLVKVAPIFQGARTIRHARYDTWSVGGGDVVYCDPPYSGTLGYPAAGEKFDSAEFWSHAAHWVDRGALVIVSESSAPDGWNILAERERKAMLRVSKGVPNDARVERLYVRA